MRREVGRLDRASKQRRAGLPDVRDARMRRVFRAVDRQRLGVEIGGPGAFDADRSEDQTGRVSQREFCAFLHGQARSKNDRDRPGETPGQPAALENAVVILLRLKPDERRESAVGEKLEVRGLGGVEREFWKRRRAFEEVFAEFAGGEAVDERSAVGCNERHGGGPFGFGEGRETRNVYQSSQDLIPAHFPRSTRYHRPCTSTLSNLLT